MATEPEEVRVAVIHGPNLNLLGQREPEVYGTGTLEDLNVRIETEAGSLGVDVEFFQSNVEGHIVDRIQQAAQRVDGFLINAAGYTHTSVAIRDALVGVGRPFVEIHLSNLFARESFRHESLLAPKAVGAIMGFGPESYILGLRGLVAFLRKS